MKIISGGQIGADIAGLRAAKKLGFETGGWMPKGFRTLDGFHPEYAELFGMKESSDRGYPQRTRLNVMLSHATIRFAYDWNSPGEKLTKKYINELNRPFMDITLKKYLNGHYWFSKHSSAAQLFIADGKFAIINIAGNADADIEGSIENFLLEVFC